MGKCNACKPGLDYRDNRAREREMTAISKIESTLPNDCPQILTGPESHDRRSRSEPKLTGPRGRRHVEASVPFSLCRFRLPRLDLMASAFFV